MWLPEVYYSRYNFVAMYNVVTQNSVAGIDGLESTTLVFDSLRRSVQSHNPCLSIIYTVLIVEMMFKQLPEGLVWKSRKQ